MTQSSNQHQLPKWRVDALIAQSDKWSIYSTTVDLSGIRLVVLHKIYQQLVTFTYLPKNVISQVFRDVALRSGGRVTVFYCGPASMARVVMAQCKKFGFTFTKEISWTRNYFMKTKSKNKDLYGYTGQKLKKKNNNNTTLTTHSNLMWYVHWMT
jgi:DNA modification methylase